MELWRLVAVAAAGFGAGLVNTVVGSGSLITYPLMVMFGVPPVSANIANTVGLVPGSIAGAWGYRRELGALKGLLVSLGAASVVGATTGAYLLTRLPAAAFTFAVPVLVLAAALLVAFQQRIAARLRPTEGTRWVPLVVVVFLSGVYGGYFSAAQGVILLGVLGLFLAVGIQEQNALKNLLQMLVNLVAAIFFVTTGPVRWDYAGAVAAGSVIGATAGAWLARRIPSRVLRLFIVVFGVIMACYLGYRALA
ncbi:hypothetical protein SAMN05443377_11360 [Propionibacterium cyclohexanicum]|uniref:Probable membrane transporter protein n=1 Tax=Propionibacterium cyclohexanicum TaxID=64702 RepID=A0A1H9SHR0_9ACTN|nr:sulfite exporter TauE/SafE family protein [Propionibacterium cyclohexanicum]SER84502.1 hypothetical protein SAMN05443377_11360 [Propionibacterium cyclohexanicum]